VLVGTEKTKVLIVAPNQVVREGVRAYQPSKAEVAFAVAFVRCARTTGLFAALDQAEPAMQQEIVERHVAEFSGLNPDRGTGCQGGRRTQGALKRS
jgi:hypothetical protein